MAAWQNERVVSRSGLTQNDVSDMERSLIWSAAERGGRAKAFEAAHGMGISQNAAEMIFFEYQNQLQPEQCFNNYQRRLDGDILNLMLGWLHLENNLPLEEIRNRLNTEILRKILLNEGVALTEIETSVNQTIHNAEKYLSNQRIREQYNNKCVESDMHVLDHLNDVVISRKYTHAPANDEVTSADRLSFAKDLLAALEDPDAVLVFMDETPFYLSTDIASGQTITHECRVSTAVDPSRGVFFSDCSVTPTTKDQYSEALWRNQNFKSFLNRMLQTLPNRKSLLQGKNVYIISDCTEDHIASVEAHQAIHGVPAFKVLSTILEKECNGKVFLIKLPSNAPALNLGEFYNKTLRERANELFQQMKSDAEFHRQILTNVDKTELNKTLLEKVLRKCLHEMQTQAGKPEAIVQMTDFIKDIIYNNGFMSCVTYNN
mmetsp:Transcript_1032/g.1666  ORF Transcript_1032/g.1666 Transcript_1032/m.1666 type:complete len:432 (-) Transcript_1032:718-2013(-)|eukprot:CAMPEP_0203789174 /NCGR_PEP_ID=MMETSP0100_2-20121128/3269_1 /ASSEMBLY_ACC=CAM_ASM_000210 /TAXON_ID=96639 /ORGANISM=" , Strain NY0313808BC1" /LENGTH=431 /DNA_ID=CAMNT_0050692025 /DNA_START=306 /DNA_END=1601 /DNA_ORIENTATION=-